MAVSLPPSRRRSGRRAPMAEINVTPMVDVMLVLLIIFMIAAPLLVTGVPINLPQSRANALEQDQQPVVLSIDDTGAIFINDEPVSDAVLPQRLDDLRVRLGTEGRLFLRADAGLDYGRVMGLMGELNRTGIARIALVTTGQSSGQASSRSSGRE